MDDADRQTYRTLIVERLRELLDRPEGPPTIEEAVDAIHSIPVPDDYAAELARDTAEILKSARAAGEHCHLNRVEVRDDGRITLVSQLPVQSRDFTFTAYFSRGDVYPHG